MKIETVGLPGAVRSRILRLAKALKWKIFHLLFFWRKRRRWAFLNTLQALDPPTFKSFALTYLRNDLEHQYLLKNSEISTLLAVVRCCVTTRLSAETFSLLKVYLKYNFGLGLPSFYLLFSLFKLKFYISKCTVIWSFSYIPNCYMYR